MTATPTPAARRRHDAGAALVGSVLADIPLTRAMGLGFQSWDGECLVLAAPLAANVNDKGCAFGGSLASLMTLAGWGLVKLALQAHGETCDIYVQDSRIRYLAPVLGDFTATARLAEGQAFAPFLETLAGRGKARIDVACVVTPDGHADAATLEARFVAIRHG
jgi:thioesterase domain-containing protein